MSSRIQVTVDPELKAAMDAVEHKPRSRSRLLRDLALRGAEVTRDEHREASEAADHLLGIANGELPHDFDAVSEIASRRGERLPG